MDTTAYKSLSWRQVIGSTSEQFRKLEGLNLRWFLLLVGLSALIGVIFGTLLDTVVDVIQKENTNNRWVCFGYVVVQILFTVLAFWVLTRIDHDFSNWLFNSYAGYIFSLLYFMAQPNLQSNMRTAVNFA